MKTSVAKATGWLVFWWVAVEIGFYWLTSRGGLASLNTRLVSGLLWGLIIGLVAMRFCRLKFLPMLLAAAGWAGAYYFSGQMIQLLVGGVQQLGTILPIDVNGPLNNMVGSYYFSNPLLGFLTGALGGLITGLCLRWSGVLADLKVAVVAVGWAVAMALGFLLDYLLFSFFFRSSGSLLPNTIAIPLMIGLSGLLISAIGGRVMFKAVEGT